MLSVLSSLRLLLLIIGALAIVETLFGVRQPLAAQEQPIALPMVAIWGGVETLQLEPVAFPMEARIDTGADLSSLDARNIREYPAPTTNSDSDKLWVSFDIEDRHSNDQTHICLPIVRHVQIKRHNGQSQCRPVVRLPVTLGHHSFTTEFTLIDRSNFHHPVLIGRNDIRDRAIVDVSRESGQ